MDRLEAMRVLVAAIDAGSLSAASRRLAMPLATVSRKVSELEAALGTKLVIRNRRRLAPTDAGADYLQACRRILDDIDEAERAAAGEYHAPRGDLTVTAPIVFGRLHVLPVVIGFLRDFPAIDVRLVLSDRAIDFDEERIDIAVRIGALPDSALRAVRVGSIRRIVCASPVLLAAVAPRVPEDLTGRPCVTFEGLTASDAWTFWKAGVPQTVRIHSRLIVTTAEAAVDAAVAGVGFARVLSYQAADALDAGRLAIVLDAFEPAPAPVQLVHAGGRVLPMKARAFLDVAAPALRARLAALSR